MTSVVTKGRLAVATLVCGLGLACAGIHFWADGERETLLARYRKTEASNADKDARRIQDVLLGVYHNLRIIAGMPGVRTIDRHATNISPGEKGTIERIYRDLNDTVELSEIYIVPRDLDPDAMDPVTHALETPIYMFDGSIATEPEGKEPQEESFEYHQMQRDLIPWFAQAHPTDASITGLNVPMISGSENHHLRQCGVRDLP